MPQNLPNNNPDQIIEDEKSLAVKDKVMHRLKANTWMNSISKVAMYVGTMLTTTGTGMALTAIAASAPITGIAIGVLAVGVAALGAAVAADFAASRIWQSATFDNLEANADSTARHLVKELKVNNMCFANAPSAASEEAPPRWTSQIEAERQQQQAFANR